jgi:DNA-directed RNA polymerase specialized sigma24 family protein
MTEPLPSISPLPALRSGLGFHSTRWTRVCLAKAPSEEGRVALAELCEAYYEPVVAFLRCELRDADGAREMAHAFFAQVLRGGTMGAVDPARGRFRSYLLGAVKHFLSHHRMAAQTMKRGAGWSAVDYEGEEMANLVDPAQPSPDAQYDKQWAVTLLSHALDRLRDECVLQGNGHFFEMVKPLLMGEGGYGEQSGLAHEAGLSLPAFRMAVHRLKRRFRQRVREEVAGTVGDSAMVEVELQALYRALLDG